MKEETKNDRGQKNLRVKSVRSTHANIPWLAIPEAQRGVKKSARRLRWFPLRANPAILRKEATKSRPAADESRSGAGARLNQTVIVKDVEHPKPGKEKLSRLADDSAERRSSAK